MSKTKFYAIAFNYPKPHASILYFIKVRDGFKPELSRNSNQIRKGPFSEFTSDDLSKLSLWLISHPQVFKVLTVITSAGKLAHAKHINKYVKGNDLLAVQRHIFLHQPDKAIRYVPSKYRVNVIKALKENFKKVSNKP